MRISTPITNHIQDNRNHRSRRKQKQNTQHVLERNQPANQIKKDKGHLQSEIKLYHQIKGQSLNIVSLRQTTTAIFFSLVYNCVFVFLHIFKSPQIWCLLIFLSNAMSES